MARRLCRAFRAILRAGAPLMPREERRDGARSGLGSCRRWPSMKAPIIRGPSAAAGSGTGYCRSYLPPRAATNAGRAAARPCATGLTICPVRSGSWPIPCRATAWCRRGGAGWRPIGGLCRVPPSWKTCSAGRGRRAIASRYPRCGQGRDLCRSRGRRSRAARPRRGPGASPGRAWFRWGATRSGPAYAAHHFRRVAAEVRGGKDPVQFCRDHALAHRIVTPPCLEGRAHPRRGLRVERIEPDEHIR